MKKMMLTAVVSLFAACGGAPVEENTAESQEALGVQGRCEVLTNGASTGYCIADNGTCAKKRSSTCQGAFGPPVPSCGTTVVPRVCTIF